MHPYLIRAGSSATVVPPRAVLAALLRTISCPRGDTMNEASTDGDATATAASLAEPHDTLRGRKTTVTVVVLRGTNGDGDYCEMRLCCASSAVEGSVAPTWSNGFTCVS